MISNDQNHFIFTLSSFSNQTPIQYKGNGILHLHDDSETQNVFDIFQGFSIYSNHTIMIYSSFTDCYNYEAKQLLGKCNSKITITKLIAFECF